MHPTDMNMGDALSVIEGYAPLSWHIGVDKNTPSRSPVYFCWVENHGFTAGTTVLDAAQKMVARLVEQVARA